MIISCFFVTQTCEWLAEVLCSELTTSIHGWAHSTDTVNPGFFTGEPPIYTEYPGVGQQIHSYDNAASMSTQHDLFLQRATSGTLPGGTM